MASTCKLGGRTLDINKSKEKKIRYLENVNLSDLYLPI